MCSCGFVPIDELYRKHPQNGQNKQNTVMFLDSPKGGGEKSGNGTRVIVIYSYFRSCIHLRFKHAVLGTHLNYLGCLCRTVGLGVVLVVGGLTATMGGGGALQTHSVLEPVPRCEPKREKERYRVSEKNREAEGDVINSLHCDTE